MNEMYTLNTQTAKEGASGMDVKLTVKEQTLYDAICKGMDEPGSGWLHEVAEETHETAGVLGSLVKKGLVHSRAVKDPGFPVAYWVEAL